ncbi:NAD(P)/FAD-dependent oxidoreductase [Porticoccus sp.]|uniref:NAD(P)/FAD-dependent oxidoreductase n=1 Tax=Porticoccus sp. TaxID=2024853 RepID=UPI003F69A42D
MNPRMIIVGTGHAAAQLASSLRQQGWTGDILLIGEEPHAPYQRPPLSKDYLAGERTLENILIRPAAAYSSHGIDLLTGRRVMSIDRATKVVVLDDGQQMNYHKLALCTGARARPANIRGVDSPGVFYLRTLADVDGIRANISPGKSAVIIGGGYVGLETAAILRGLGMKVTLLELQTRILARVCAPEVSDFYSGVHREQGVDIRTGIEVLAIENNHGGAKRVSCTDGSRFHADLIIVGVGVIPNVELAEACGLVVNDGILVDQFARTSDPDIVAAGDCTNHPNGLLGRRVRLESVPNAVEQAKTAAGVLCNRLVPYQSYPWFWSDQYELKLQIAGLSEGYDQVVVRGAQDRQKGFVVWYLRAGRLLAADCINRPKEFMVARQLLVRALAVDPVALVDETIDPKSWLD